MAIRRHLKNAPIREAILDIRVRLPASVDHNRLLSVHPKIERQYPDRQVQWKDQFEIPLGESDVRKPASIEKGINGYLYRSAKDKQIAQFRLDGFTFNKLKPYDKWESFRDEARRLWELYIEAASPECITKIALRYINHLFVPGPLIDFDDYLTEGPKVPKNLPQGVSSFLTRVVVNEPEINAIAIITQALEKIIKPDIIPIILDIDAIKEGEFEAKGQEVWETFEKLRHFKNRIFFESVTEKTLELFE